MSENRGVHFNSKIDNSWPPTPFTREAGYAILSELTRQGRVCGRAINRSRLSRALRSKVPMSAHAAWTVVREYCQENGLGTPRLSFQNVALVSAVLASMVNGVLSAIRGDTVVACGISIFLALIAIFRLLCARK